MTLPLLNSQARYDAWLSDLVEDEIHETRRDLASAERDFHEVADDEVKDVLMERQMHELRKLDVFSHEDPQVLGNIVWYSRTDPARHNNVTLGERPRQAFKELAHYCLDADIRSEVEHRL